MTQSFKDFKYIISRFLLYFVFWFFIFLLIFTINFIYKYSFIIYSSEISSYIKIKIIYYNMAWMYPLASIFAVVPSILLLFKRNIEKNKNFDNKYEDRSIYKITIPILICSFVLSIFSFLFIDIVLPDANHYARNYVLSARMFIADTSSQKMFKIRNDNFRSDREMNIESMLNKIEMYEENINNRFKELDQSINEIYNDTTFIKELMYKIFNNKIVDNSFIQNGELRDRGNEHKIDEIKKSIHKFITIRKSIEGSINRYRLEIHKKHSIPFGILSLTIFIIPFALLFKKLGWGKIVNFTFLFMILFWMFLILGEDYSDRILIPIWLGMWLPHIILIVSGLSIYLFIKDKYILTLKNDYYRNSLK